MTNFYKKEKKVYFHKAKEMGWCGRSKRTTEEQMKDADFCPLTMREPGQIVTPSISNIFICAASISCKNNSAWIFPPSWNQLAQELRTFSEFVPLHQNTWLKVFINLNRTRQLQPKAGHKGKLEGPEVVSEGHCLMCATISPGEDFSRSPFRFIVQLTSKVVRFCIHSTRDFWRAALFKSTYAFNKIEEVFIPFLCSILLIWL